MIKSQKNWNRVGNYTKGFTLVEILVSISIFVVFMTFALGSVLSILGAGDKSKSLNSVMTNLNFTVEIMSRELKFGTNFYCTQSTDVPPLPPVPTTQNCTGVGLAPQSAISFVTSDGVATVYKLDSALHQIKKSTDGGLTFISVTAPEVNIQDLKFYVFNSAPQTSLPADNAQPRVTMFVRGYAGTKLSSQSSFALQTTISQRSLDVAPVTVVVSSNPVYIYCADEGGVCSFSGIGTVRYGASGSYSYQSNVNGSIACTNAVFGDPIIGTAKSCYYSITSQNPPPCSDVGLITCWLFDEGSGSTVADSTGGGYTGTVQGAQSWNSSGHRGSALNFNGSNTYIPIPGPIFSGYPTTGNTSTYDLTFSTWFKTSSVGGIILGQTNTATVGLASGYVPAIYIDNTGKVRASMFWHNNPSNQIVTSFSYNDGNWHKLTDTYSNGQETLYIDGVQIGSQAQSQTSYSSTYYYYLGAGYGEFWPGLAPAADYFNGSLDDVRFYSRALSSNEIDALP